MSPDALQKRIERLVNPLLVEVETWERIADIERQKRDQTLRRDAAGDEVARQKLGDALESLDSQVLALRQLGAAYERVDGEYTALLITLHELKTRISLAKSAGSAVKLDGLRQNVGGLSSMLVAITGALEVPAQTAAQVRSSEEAGHLAAERIRSRG